MTNDVVVSAAGLPRSELDRLLGEVAGETGAMVQPGEPATRGALGPETVTALVQATVTVAMPFITLLAAKLFSRDPKAQVEVRPPDQEIASSPPPGAIHAAVPETTLLLATQSPEERERLMLKFMDHGVGHVAIIVGE